jgi:TRAP-type C4-dicarboxylate transport system substrate-binding protein
MQTGVVDAMDDAKTTCWLSKFYEVGPHFTDLGHIHSISAVGEEGVRLQDRLIAEGDEAAMAKAVAAGAKYHKVDKAPWQKAMLPIYQNRAPKVGGMEMIKAAQDTP